LGLSKDDPCPELSFGEHGATCRIAASGNLALIGVGSGCCIKATAYQNGVAYDFAGLPPAFKHHIARKRLKEDNK
jgi:hypothetical protein